MVGLMRKLLLMLLLVIALPVEAQISFIGSTSARHATGGDLTQSVPGTYATDDFAIAMTRGLDSGTNPVYAITVATGWTALRNDNWAANDTDMQFYIWYKKLTSASETDLTFTSDTANSRAVAIHVFRGVDTTTPFDTTEQYAEGNDAANPSNPAITTVTNNAAVYLLHGYNNNDVTVSGAPSGYTLGSHRTSTAHANQGHASAYDLDVGASGTETPGAWTHTASPTNVQDYQLYTIALRPAAASSSVPVISQQRRRKQ